MTGSPNVADALMAIFGMHRVSEADEKADLYREHRELVDRQFDGTATPESNARLEEVRAALDKLQMAEMFPDACPGELSLEDRYS